LIGINTAIASPTGGNIGLGFAIPSNMVRTVSKQLIDKGRIVRPWLGVQMAAISGDFAAWYEQHGYKGRNGVIVIQAMPGSPAEKKGLMQGDVITQIDDKKLTNPDALVDEINKHKVGNIVRLSVWRMGQTQMVVIKLEEMPPDAG